MAVNVNHDYNWHDATSQHSPTPIDPHGHGTFTLSQMVGDDGQGNQVGVAPGAQWIACRNMDASGTGSPSSYTECFQFLIAPYPLRHPELADPSKAPDLHQQLVGMPDQRRLLGQYAARHHATRFARRASSRQSLPATAAPTARPSLILPRIYASSVTVGA